MLPNTVSRRIQELERELGLRLFHRSTRRLTLTDTVQELFDRCAEYVEVLAQSAEYLEQGSHLPRGTQCAAFN
jgi:DNA-binding transcriptional LysR family regulator